MNYFKTPNYFGIGIVFCSLCKLHFLVDDSHVLPDTKLGRLDSNTPPLGLHPTPYCEEVSIGHTRRRHACSRVNRVIVSIDKFWHNVNISVRVPQRKISVQFISDRLWHIPRPHIWHRDFCELESECPHHVESRTS